jgi:hypothetical protein
MSQIKLADVKRRRGIWPFMGLMLAVALGIISYFLAPTVIRLTGQLLPQFRTGGIPGDQLRLIFSALTFVVLLLVTALLVAIFMPKKPMLVKESDLRKEREQMLAGRKADKVRQRKINLATQQYLKEKSKRGE